MTMYPSSSTQQPAAICALKSPADAIHILEAVRLGLVPRVTRRLTGHERTMIRPGTVWVWEEEETNMRRWTDGRRWGASRVGGGGFLVYTESSDSMSPPPSRADSPSYAQYYNGNGNGREGGSGSASGSASAAGGAAPPSNSTPPRRPEPLVKQTYSTSMTHPVTGKTKKFHVVAYSSKRNPQGDGANPLPLPHQLPNLANIKITPGIWPDWETRRDDYGARRSVAASAGPGSHVPLPQDHNGHPQAHAQPHHLPSGPGTPVTATSVPYPHPESAYRPASPPRDVPYPLPPQSAVDSARPLSAPHPDYRRGPPYSPYDVRPPYPYDMYPPPDRYHPYYPPSRGADLGPGPPPGHLPPPDYAYDPRYYEGGRERERERGREPRPEDLDPRARYYPPPHAYYRDPRDTRDPRDYDRDGDKNGDARDARDVRDPRDARDPRAPESASRDPYAHGHHPYLPRGYPYPPYMPYGAYPPRDPRDDYPPPPASSSHLGKRTPDRTTNDAPEPKRPMWSPHQAPREGGADDSAHARQPSGGSAVSATPRDDVPPASRDLRPISGGSRTSRSPRGYASDAGSVSLPPLRDVADPPAGSANGARNGSARSSPRSEQAWR